MRVVARAATSCALVPGITRVILVSMKTAISIPDSVFEAAEQLARRLGMSRSRLYSTAVAEYLLLQRNRGVTEQLDAVYTEEGSALDPALLAAQAASLGDEDWSGES